VGAYGADHSFATLDGGGEAVRGRPSADAGHTTQIGQAGAPYHCLLQNDGNLTSPDPLSPVCTDTTTATTFVSHFLNAPFSIETYIPTTARTCPPPGAFMANGFKAGTGDPGGCTRDI